MSDQSLRDALGEAWDDGNATGLDGYVGPGRGAGEVDREAERARDRILDKLLPHVAEPAPVVTEETVETATIAWYEATPGVSWEQAGKCERAAMLARTRLILEAAAPLLGPRPLLDREAVQTAARDFNYDRMTLTGFVDAVMQLARPMPTQEQIEQAVQAAGIGSYRTIVARAVLALLNGAES